jgi:hypothetical protein
MAPIIDLELTNACPADCVMCPRDALPKLGVMKDGVFELVLEELAGEPGLAWISLCGIGEPLLHPKILPWVRRLRELPSRPGVGLVTAGEKLVPDVYHALADAGLAQIEVSVQAVEPELYAQLMPGLDFTRVMENLAYIAKTPLPPLAFALSYTEHLANRAHTAAVQRYASERGFRIGMTQIHSRAGNVINPALLVGSRPVAQERGCRIFDKIHFIAWDGRVHYCCHDARREHVIGDLSGEGLSAIRERKRALVEAHGGPPARICAACDDPLRSSL